MQRKYAYLYATMQRNDIYDGQFRGNILILIYIKTCDK